VGDGVVVLQLDDVRFIGIIVYIYNSKKRNKPFHILPKMGGMEEVCFVYIKVMRHLITTASEQQKTKNEKR